MAHLIPATHFRNGKSFLWRSNLLVSKQFPKILSGHSSFIRGVEKTLKYVLKRKRLFIVKGNIKYSQLRAKFFLNILYMPKMKRRPRPDSFGRLFNQAVYKNWFFKSKRFLKISKRFVRQRRLKTYKFYWFAPLYTINKWLTKRMLRGVTKPRFWNFINYRNNKRVLLKVNKKSFFRKSYLRKIIWPKRWLFYCLKKRKKINIPQIKIKKKNKNYTRIYKIKKIKHFKVKILNKRKLSFKLSKLLHVKIRIKTLNIFAYLALKNIIEYKTHQEHFWHYKYRRYRFFYGNYFDIVNAFFILGIIKNSENLLLDISRITMPKILKMRRFLFFLDNIIKNLSQIVKNFKCFRLIITGKILGGTRRTKSWVFGFGGLPIQSITVDGISNFICFTHKYGEFGLRLIMNRVFKKLEIIEQIAQ